MEDLEYQEAISQLLFAVAKDVPDGRLSALMVPTQGGLTAKQVFLLQKKHKGDMFRIRNEMDRLLIAMGENYFDA